MTHGGAVFRMHGDILLHGAMDMFGKNYNEPIIIRDYVIGSSGSIAHGSLVIPPDGYGAGGASYFCLMSMRISNPMMSPP